MNGYDNLYETVKQKLGPKKAEELRNSVMKKIKREDLLSKLSKEQKGYLETVLGNPKLLSELLSDPKTEIIINKLIGGDKNG